MTKLSRLSTPLFMKKARIWEHLDKADEHIKRGETRVNKQEERVKELASGGYQIKNAEETLKYLHELLGNMKKHRDLVREELKKSSEISFRTI